MEMENMTNSEGFQNPHQRLDEIWARLNDVCRKLWQEDSPAAVGLEAITEEFKGEVRRLGQALAASQKTLSEQKYMLSKEFNEFFSDQILELKSQISRGSVRIAALEKTLASREAEIDNILKALADKEAENVKFHDEYLKAASQSDELQARKMEVFYQELKNKEAELEKTWESRKKALEDDHRQHIESLQKKEKTLEEKFAQREKELRDFQERFMQERMTWESQTLQQREIFNKREEDLKKQSQDLLSEYKIKQDELQRIKDGMKSEIAELVHQYQAKLKAQSHSS